MNGDVRVLPMGPYRLGSAGGMAYLRCVKELLKRALGNEFLLSCSKGNRFIFCYHDVSDPGAPHHSSRYSTTPTRFKEHVDLFTGIFTILPLDVLVNEPNLSGGRNYAALTFDDGFHSVLTHAWPLLKAGRLPFTVFLNGTAVLHNRGWITDLVLASHDAGFVHRTLATVGLTMADDLDPIGSIMARGRFTADLAQRPVLSTLPKTYLDSDDVLRLHRDGVAFGDHGYEHCVLSRTDDRTLEKELSTGRDLIGDITGSVPRHFALPFGKRDHYDDRSLGALRRHGFTHLYTTSMNRLRSRQLGGGSLLPRISVMDEPVGQLLFYINRSLLRTFAL